MNDETKNGLAGISDAERLLYGGFVEESPELSGLAEKGETEVAGWRSSMQDFFSGAYKFNPKLAEASSENTVARRIMSEVMKTREFNDLRNYTKADSLASTMASKALGEATLSNLPEDVKKAANEKAEAEAKVEDLLNALDPSNPDPEAKESVEELIKRIQALNEVIENADLDGVRRAVRAAAVKAAEEASETQEGLAVFGCGTGEGDSSNVSPSERLELAKRLSSSKKLQNIAEIAGRLTRIALRVRETRVSHGRDEIFGVEQGDDLGRVLPAELVGLATGGAFETLFLKKFSEKQLLQYAVRGTEEKGRGPMVVCLDESGSMSGDPEFFGKGIVLALLALAKKDKRDFSFIQFGSRHQLATTSFPKGEAEPKALMNAVERFFGGGTDFEAPLNKALDVIEENEFKDADVVFITDGGANLSQAFVKRFETVKAAKGFEVFSIVIGYGAVDGVKDFSDRVEDWSNPEAAAAVFSQAVEKKREKR